MLAIDAFRTRLGDAILRLQSWAKGLSDVADVAETKGRGFYRLSIQPHEANACPVELILRDDQNYDAQIGPESYENRPIEQLEIFLPMLEAIAAGRVVTRSWRTSATETLHSVETILSLDGGILTGERDIVGIADAIPRDRCIALDRHWAPYRR